MTKNIRFEYTQSNLNHLIEYNTLCQLISTRTILIATNQIHKRYQDVSASYRHKYSEWMDRAVSSLIHYVDYDEQRPFKHSAMYFDAILTGTVHGSPREKKARIHVKKGTNHIEFIVDTVHFDNGDFDASINEEVVSKYFIDL